MMAKNELAMSTAGVEWKAGAHGGWRCEKQQAGTAGWSCCCGREIGRSRATRRGWAKTDVATDVRVEEQ